MRKPTGFPNVRCGNTKMQYEKLRKINLKYMMRDKFKKSAWIGLLALVLCTGCQNQDTPFDASSKDTHQNMTDLTSGKNVGELPDLGSSFATILGQSTRDFRQGYPLDESFLMWIGSTYGAGMVEQLAAYVEKGGTDTKIWHQLTGDSLHVLWLRYCRAYGYATYQLDNVSWKNVKAPNVVEIAAVGDINFSEDWYTMDAYRERGEDLNACISPEIQNNLQSADVTIVNNEFTYSLRGEPLEGKAYVFRADPERVTLLERLGTDIAALGNNHVYDYGEEALLDTLDVLTDAGIPYVGAGHEIEEASQPQYLIVGGYKIAVVCATQIERYSNYTKEATADSPGVLKTVNPQRYIAAIEEARENSDFVIAYVHWGAEGMLYRTEDVRALAEQYVQAGADIIIGNHPHRLQGAEFIEGVPVLYSLGNFWFSDGSIYTAIAQIRIEEAGISVGMLPCKQENMTTSLLTTWQEQRNFYQYVADISENVAIDEAGFFYDLSEPGAAEAPGFRAAYLSGQNYASHMGDYDLEGRQIDIVGNRISQ